MKKTLILIFIVLTTLAYAQSSEQGEPIDYAYMWKNLDESNRNMFVIGIRTGILIPMMILENIQPSFEDDGRLEQANEISNVYKMLEIAIYNVDGDMISGTELKLRIDIYYLDDDHKYDRFEIAAVNSIVDAAKY